MRARCSVAVAVAAVTALGACERPEALLVCHNANCAEPADPTGDDTIAALRESLALEYRGRPAIDGIELDSFWRGADDRCLYAHDLANNQENTPATEPALELAAHFARPGPIAYADAPFQVLLELKSHVSEDTGDRHTPAQRQQHARCAWDIYDILATAAVANGRDVEVVFSAFAPELLREVVAQAPLAPPIPYRLGAIQGVPAPLDDQTRPLDDYRGLPIDIVEFHAHWILDAQYEAAISLGAEISMFMFSATVETFAAIEQYEPAHVVTSEARLLRRWLED